MFFIDSLPRILLILMRQLSNQQDIEDLVPWLSGPTTITSTCLPHSWLRILAGKSPFQKLAWSLVLVRSFTSTVDLSEIQPRDMHHGLGKASQSFPYSDAFAKGLHTTFDGRFVFEQSLGEFHDSYEGPSSDLIWPIIDVRRCGCSLMQHLHVEMVLASLMQASILLLANELCLCCPEVVFIVICGFAGASPLGWSLWSTPHRQFQNGDVGSNQFTDLNPTAVIMLESLRQNIVESGEVFAPGGMCLGIWLYTGIISTASLFVFEGMWRIK